MLFLIGGNLERKNHTQYFMYNGAIKENPAMTRRLAIISLVAVLTTLTGLFVFCWAGTRDAQWKQVDEAIQKGLPKTAIEHLDPIIAGAIKDKAYPEAIKAIGKKIALEGNIQGNKPEEKITRLQAEIAKSPKEMQPVMTAILAHWYWQYFQHNRWRFVQRTATAEPPGEDILSWDLPRILAEIDKHFTAALANEAELKKIPIAQYNDLLDKGTMPDTYRPTLFDFLAFEALKFYSSGEQAGSKAEDAFELTADSPIFGSVEDFLAWDVKTSDAGSLTVRAIRLLPERVEVPHRRQGAVGVSRRQPGPLAVRLQPGGRRRQGHPLQGRAAEVCREVGRP